jgi:hypothetical protein
MAVDHHLLTKLGMTGAAPLRGGVAVARMDKARPVAMMAAVGAGDDRVAVVASMPAYRRWMAGLPAPAADRLGVMMGRRRLRRWPTMVMARGGGRAGPQGEGEEGDEG